MFSQNEEEKVICDYFKGVKGRFLDVGAYDGKTFSNTHRLALDGWEGVCIEPVDESYEKLVDNYKDMPGIKCKKCAVAGSCKPEGEIYKCVSGTEEPLALSTLDTMDLVKLRSSYDAAFVTQPVEVLTFTEIFEEYGKNFNFVNIDTEGLSLILLLNMPISKMPALRCICVEHGNKFSEVTMEALYHNFRNIYVTHENMILMK